MFNNDFEIELNVSKDTFMNRFMPYLYIQNGIEIDLDELKGKKYEAKLRFDRFEIRSIRSNIYTSKSPFGESIIGEIEEIDSDKILIIGEVKINLFFETLLAIVLFISIFFGVDVKGLAFLFIFLVFNLIQTYNSIQIAKKKFFAFLKSL